MLSRRASAILVHAALFALAAPAAAQVQPVRKVVPAHGAWVDASGLKPVYEPLPPIKATNRP